MKILLLYLLLISSVFASERDIQELWCEGKTEHRLPDKTRIDCLTGEYAIEVDWAHKPYNAIGQSLYYSAMTGKKPGILIILLDPKDCRFVERINKTNEIKKLDIKVWTTPFECDE